MERMITRLGHQPLSIGLPTPERLTSADVLVVEPVAPVGTALAQAAAIAVPLLPLICASVSAPPPELQQLGVRFTASLLKPFTIEQLGEAINQALRERQVRRPPYPRENQSAA
jgi:hypothetical protein